MTKLPTLDLFTGIGGFALALASVCQPVGYCERDAFCRSLLERLMRDRQIPQARIHDDVCELRGPCCPVAPVVVTGGFPCQDISIMGKGSGIDGGRSRMFFELVRIVREQPSVQAVFLENSSALSHRGWHDVLAALRKAGLSKLAYGTFTASEIGGLHRRTRMYMLACKPGASEVLGRLSEVNIRPYDWSRELCPRLLKRGTSHKERLQRCMALGNAVVPQVAAYACQQLSAALLGRLKEGAGVKTQRIIVNSNHRSESNYLRAPIPHSVRHPPHIMSDGNRSIVHQLWMTPVHAAWHQYRTMTDRGSRLLSNQIYWDDATRHAGIDKVPKPLRSTVYDINPAFIEFLMGYPPDWTNVVGLQKKKLIPSGSPTQLRTQ